MDDGSGDVSADGVHRRSVLGLGAVAGAAVASGAMAAVKPGDITALNAVALQKAIRTRAVSCVEVMGAYLDRIEQVNPAHNAIVALQPREALIRQAGERDAQLARGEAVGPLHGFPHAVKDLQAVKGIRYTQGSPVYRDTVAAADSLMVERLRAAGVVFIGKTNTPEFGLGSHTFNPVYGVTRNAYDPTKSAGGSSGGAAVALALNMAPLADGSDYAGSLRNPAGWNAVYGFRTSIGRVAAHVREDWLPSMGVQGPMARNVADLALLLSVQAGFDSRAPLSIDGDGSDFRPPIRGDVKGRRIAWAGDFGGFTPNEPGVLETCRGALKTFAALGCVVEDAYPAFDLEKVWGSFIRLRGWQQGGNLLDIYNDPARRPLLKPEAVLEVETGLKLSAFDVLADSIVRSDWTQAVRRFFERYDYLIAPTAQLFPFDAAETWPRTVAGRPMRTYHEWMQAVCLVTMSGCPALAAPAGFGPGGLPMGIQVVAPVHHELDCLQLAFAYEQASGGRLRRRPGLLTMA